MDPAMSKPQLRATRLRVAVSLALCLAGATAAAVGLLGTPSAFGATAGQAEIVAPGSTDPLTAGGSATPFGVLLPGGARCPGDSTKHPWYRASSYLLPKGTSPTTVNFKQLLPDRGLYFAAFGAPWMHQNVEKGTGLVQVPESFDISRFGPSNLLASGAQTASWDGGVACVADATGIVSNYWNVEFTFRRSTTDPGGFTWTATAPAHLDGSGGSSHWLIGAAFAGLLLVGVVVFNITRPRHQRSDRRA